MNTILTGPFDTYKEELQEFGCMGKDIAELQTRWNEVHRQYHTVEHLTEILNLNLEFFKNKDGNAELNKSGLASGKENLAYKMLLIAAFFHDAIYDPSSKTNEEDSAKMFRAMCDPKNIEDKAITPEVLDVIEKIILDSKDHTKPPTSELSRIFLEFDLHGLSFGSLPRMIADEKKILKEYGAADYGEYKAKRGFILKIFAAHIKKNINPDSHVDEYVDWFMNREIKIAVYPGTFHPLHKGHLDILHKAEKIFDKVILAFGVNPAKSDEKAVRVAHMKELQKKMPNHQIEMFEGMLTKYIAGKEYPLSIVKGLRNPTDFDSERLQLRYMEDMDPNISIVYIISDRKYEHISSSGIRLIKAADSDEKLISPYLA